MLTSMLTNAQTNGAGTALDCTLGKKATVYITGTFDAAVKFEASLDGTNWFSYVGKVNGSLDSAVAYKSCYVVFDVEGLVALRLNVQNYSSGAVSAVGYVEGKSGESGKYYHINSTTTGVLVANGPVLLKKLTINNAGSAMVITMYDGTSTSGNVVAAVSSAPVGTLYYDAELVNGLYLVVSATTAGDATLVYM